MYIIRKDGMWLASCRHTGIKEIMTDGKLSDVFTGLWSDRIADAKTFEDEFEVRRIARAVGGELMTVTPNGKVVSGKEAN